MRKAVVVVSGGLDSVVLMYHMAQHNETYALAFDYGQKNIIELERVRVCAALAGVPLRIVWMPRLNEVLTSGLTSEDHAQAEGEYNEASMRSTFVPNRNAIFLSIAYGYAVSIGAEAVAFGVHGGVNRESLTPDCRPEFTAAMDEACRLGNLGMASPYLKIIAPFGHMSKAGIVTRGHELGVSFAETWSCYLGDTDVHCGTCGACTERKKAFTDAAVTDPTEYLA